MHPLLAQKRIAAGCLILLSLTAGGCHSPADHGAPAAPAVSYEAFGAVGDGVADDLPAIVAAHAHANQHGLPVRSNPDATYHLGTRALTAIIQTNTDWNTSRFIIDDSAGVERLQTSLFRVQSSLKPERIEIKRLARGQERLDVRPANDLLVLVENANRKLYIRKGQNLTAGTSQAEVFILRKDGTIEGGIEWDYEVVTKVTTWPIDPEPLVISGGHFTSIANQAYKEVGKDYWARNIQINRSNTVIDGITVRVTGEGEFGEPYIGFLRAQRAANITFRNCRIDGRKTYRSIGRGGRPVPNGSYGYRADQVVNFTMINCKMDDIHDRTRWGIVATNFMKNILIEDCELSRMDVHMGVSGHYIIRRTSLGHAGLQAIGSGLLLIEESTVYSRSLITFRPDYGSTWDGEVIVRNSRWVPADYQRGNLAIFSALNDGSHDFGYPCSMPESIQIDGLVIDDSNHSVDETYLTFFNDPLGAPVDQRLFPLRLTERLEVRGLTTASGRQPHISDNPELVAAVTVVVAD